MATIDTTYTTYEQLEKQKTLFCTNIVLTNVEETLSKKTNKTSDDLKPVYSALGKNRLRVFIDIILKNHSESEMRKVYTVLGNYLEKKDIHVPPLQPPSDTESDESDNSEADKQKPDTEERFSKLESKFSSMEKTLKTIEEKLDQAHGESGKLKELSKELGKMKDIVNSLRDDKTELEKRLVTIKADFESKLNEKDNKIRELENKLDYIYMRTN